MSERIKLTEKDLTRLKEEYEKVLDQYNENKEKLKEARELGDLSENAEYHSAKERQESLQEKLNELEITLNSYELVARIDPTVTYYDYEDDEEYTVVLKLFSANRVNDQEIAENTPLGSALLNGLVGSEVTVKAPKGDYKIKIISKK